MRFLLPPLVVCIGISLSACTDSRQAQSSARQIEDRLKKEAERDDWPFSSTEKAATGEGKSRAAFPLSVAHIIHGAFHDSTGRLVATGSTMISRRLPGSYQYDSSFGSSATGSSTLPGTSRFSRSIAQAPDGKYWITGRVSHTPYWRLALWRVFSNGQIDTSFGTAGVRGYTFGSGSTFGRDIQVDAQGRIVVAGYSYRNQTTDALVVRFFSDGNLDTSFATNGAGHYALGASDDEIVYKLLPYDNGFYLSGSVHRLGDRGQALVARIQSNGELDTAWQTTGLFIHQYGSNGDTWAKDIALTSSGELAFYSIARTGARAMTVMGRLATSGNFDTSFNTVGYLEITAGTGQFTAVPTFGVKTDGSYVAAVPHRYLVRIYSNGTLDTGFGDNADGTMDATLLSSVVLVAPSDAFYLNAASSAFLYYTSRAALSIYSTSSGDPSTPTRFGYVAATTGTRTATLQLRGVGIDTVTGLTGGTVSAPFSFVGGSFPGSGGTCGSSLGMGSTCLVNIEIGTTAAGTLDDFVSFNYNDNGVAKTMPHYVMARGSHVTADTSAYTFADGAACSGDPLTPYSVTITNQSGTTITDLTGTYTGNSFWDGGGAFPGTGGTCTNSLSHGDSCTVHLGQNDPDAMQSSSGIIYVYSPTLDQGAEISLTATWTPADGDSDGYHACLDCDDDNAAVNPGANESSLLLCDNGIDEDCSGLDLVCADTDFDGDGYTQNTGDCDETNNLLTPADLDFDTYSTCAGDCNDADINVYPGNGC